MDRLLEDVPLPFLVYQGVYNLSCLVLLFWCPPPIVDVWRSSSLRAFGTRSDTTIATPLEHTPKPLPTGHKGIPFIVKHLVKQQDNKPTSTGANRSIASWMIDPLRPKILNGFVGFKCKGPNKFGCVIYIIIVFQDWLYSDNPDSGIVWIRLDVFLFSLIASLLLY